MLSVLSRIWYTLSQKFAYRRLEDTVDLKRAHSLLRVVSTLKTIEIWNLFAKMRVEINSFVLTLLAFTGGAILFHSRFTNVLEEAVVVSASVHSVRSRLHWEGGDGRIFTPRPEVKSRRQAETRWIISYHMGFEFRADFESKLTVVLQHQRHRNRKLHARTVNTVSPP